MFILKATTPLNLSQTNVQIFQCRQSLSETVGYHRDLVAVQAAKEIEGKANQLYTVQTYSNWDTVFILKAHTIQSLSQTNVQISQCRQSLSEIVGYHRDLVVVQGAKEINGRKSKLVIYGANLFKPGQRFSSSKPTLSISVPNQRT